MVIKMNIKDIIDNKNNQYMFHGSAKKLQILKPMQATDSNGTLSNIDTAIFLADDFLYAVPYAFKDSIIANSKGLDWSFSIPSSTSKYKMIMKNVRVDETIIGYIYVFNKTDDMKNDPIGSKQWKSYTELKPLHIIEVCYKDYKKYFKIEK